jgi:hypothetical protein
VADEFLLVAGGRVARGSSWRELVADEAVRAYLGPEIAGAAEGLG